LLLSIQCISVQWRHIVHLSLVLSKQRSLSSPVESIRLIAGNCNVNLASITAHFVCFVWTQTFGFIESCHLAFYPCDAPLVLYNMLSLCVCPFVRFTVLYWISWTDQAVLYGNVSTANSKVLLSGTLSHTLDLLFHYYSVPDRGVEYCDDRVCLFICLRSYLWHNKCDLR